MAADFMPTLEALLAAGKPAVAEPPAPVSDDGGGTRLKAAATPARLALTAHEQYVLEQRVAAQEAKQGTGPAQEDADEGDGEG